MTQASTATADRGPRRRRLKALRRFAGERGLVESQTRSMRNAVRYKMGKPIAREDLFAWHRGPGPRVGVYGLGGCDVRNIVRAGPALGRDFTGSLAISIAGHAPETRSDVLLQTLDPPPHEVAAEVTSRLGLLPGYFEPRLFTPTFSLKRQMGVGEFSKSVVVLSISTDVARTVYRHREHGLLVDPGGWWLNSDLGSVLGDLSVLKWFAANFKKAHRIDVEESMRNFERIITEVRTRTGAFVVVLNVLTVDPGRIALDYSHANSPNRVRRRQFGIALTELARRMQFPVLDVDRIAKEVGISGQADFVHNTGTQKQRIGIEFAELVRSAGVLQP